MGVELHQPAEATGKLKAGQIIETINGQKLADIDPRIQLGHILAEAEATDGVITFMVKENADAEADPAAWGAATSTRVAPHAPPSSRWPNNVGLR